MFKDFAPKKFLFIVHREQILNQATKSFKRVFNGEDSKFGLLSGNSKEYDDVYYVFYRNTLNNLEFNFVIDGK